MRCYNNIREKKQQRTRTKIKAKVFIQWSNTFCDHTAGGSESICHGGKCKEQSDKALHGDPFQLK